MNPNFWARLLGGGPGQSPEPSAPDLQHELEATLRELRSEAARLEIRGAPGSAAERPRLERAWRQAREQARERLAEDILRLHARFGTGLDAPELERLRAALPGSWPQPNDSLECRLETHVLDFLFQRVGALAWDQLLGLSESQGVSWPVAPELVHGREPESLARVMRQHQDEVRANFLQQTPRACADLLVGEVAAWSFGYPEERSWLWRDTALRAVGSALRVQLFLRAVEAWRQRPEQLEQELQDLLRPHVESSRQRLSSGQVSPGQAVRLLEDLQLACREAVPLKVWCFVRPQLSERPAPDPACGCEPAR